MKVYFMWGLIFKYIEQNLFKKTDVPNIHARNAIMMISENILSIHMSKAK